MGRVEVIVSHIDKAKICADVGCDHGYVGQALLKLGKAEKVIFTDISEKCLSKAKTLAQEDIVIGRAKTVVCDGLTGVTDAVDTVVIAGMGGEEIIKILSECLPRLPIETLVLQPMKNADKLRAYLLDGGFSLIRDYTFMDAGKYYDLIKAVKTDEKEDVYSTDELIFGKENLTVKGADFISRCKKEIEDLTLWGKRENISVDTINEFNERIKKLKTIIGEL